MIFSQTRVLVVGDVFLDRYVHGSATRLSPEAPVPILKQSSESAVLGGAGNVAANIAALGGKATLAAAIGVDEAGFAVHVLAEAAGIATIGKPMSGRTTAVKTRYLAGHQQVLRVDQEAEGPTGGIPFLDAAIRAVDQADVVVLSDYDKGVLSTGPAQAIIAAAEKHGVPVIADPRVADWARYAGATVVTPNRDELSAAAGECIEGDEAIIKAARRLIRDYNLSAIVATRSEEGLSVIIDENVHHIRSKARAVFDVSGAGDTVVAALACGIGLGMALDEAARIANVAAGIAVGKIGTATVTNAELWDALGPTDILIDRDHLLTRVQNWRSQGLSVGFTNGCFDLFHAGHLSTLKFAKSHCDRLIVAVNSDESVARLKGAGRPISRDRAAMVAALSGIDAVVIFDDSPLDLVKAVRPDVMVKGDDYAGQEIVGAEYAERVVLAPMVPEISTTELVRRCSTAT